MIGTPSGQSESFEAAARKQSVILNRTMWTDEASEVQVPVRRRLALVTSDDVRVGAVSRNGAPATTRTPMFLSIAVLSLDREMFLPRGITVRDLDSEVAT